MPEPKRACDAPVIGGGGHCLACADDLAKMHGLTSITAACRQVLTVERDTRTTRCCELSVTRSHAADLHHALQALGAAVRI